MRLIHSALHSGRFNNELHYLPYPKLQDGAVILKVVTAGICGTDLHAYRYDDSFRNTPDGHEYVGYVVEVGGGVTSLKIGQRVSVDPMYCSSCGTCEYCKRGQFFHCENRKELNGVGGFAEYIQVNAKGCFVLPDEISDEIGILVEPLAVATHAVRMLDIQPGMSGVIIGGGSIGLCALAASLFAGAKDVFVVARYSAQQEVAKKLGAVDSFSNDSISELLKSKYPSGVDFVIEAVGGNAATLDLACELVKPQGSLCVLGAFNPDYKKFNLLSALLKEITVKFSNCYGVKDGRHDFEVAIENLRQEKNILFNLITHKYPLNMINEAFVAADNKKNNSIKVLINVSADEHLKKSFMKLDFSEMNPSGIKNISGVYDVEGWGRWSSGDSVQLEFDTPLPQKIGMELNARAFGPNINETFHVSLGDESLSFKLPNEQDKIINLQFENSKNSKVLNICIPNAASPLSLGINADSRMLGLGLVSLIIYE